MCYLSYFNYTFTRVRTEFTVASFTSHPIDISITTLDPGAPLVIKIHLPPIHDRASTPAFSS